MFNEVLRFVESIYGNQFSRAVSITCVIGFLEEAFALYLSNMHTFIHCTTDHSLHIY